MRFLLHTQAPPSTSISEGTRHSVSVILVALCEANAGQRHDTCPAATQDDSLRCTNPIIHHEHGALVNTRIHPAPTTRQRRCTPVVNIGVPQTEDGKDGEQDGRSRRVLAIEVPRLDVTRRDEGAGPLGSLE